jgi:hypothetical protein
MKYNPGVAFALTLTIAGAVNAPAQTTTSPFPSGPLQPTCGARYQVQAGTGTALYDPDRSRKAARDLSWDALEKIRYPRAIRSTKDLPSTLSPTRRLGGFESTLWAIEGTIECPDEWSERSDGETFILKEDGPKSKLRTLRVSFPRMSCTYGSSNFERIKDLNREMEALTSSPGICRHVKIIGFGYWSDSGAQVTHNQPGVAGEIAPLLDIIPIDETDGSEIEGSIFPDPKEAFIASLSVTARRGREQAALRANQRDGVWLINASAPSSSVLPIPFEFGLSEIGNNPLKPTTGSGWGLAMQAPPGKALTSGGYVITSNIPDEKRPRFSFGVSGISCSFPIRESFSIARQRWDCVDKSEHGQELHLVEMQATWSQQCFAFESSSWTSISGRLSYIAPEQVPCRFASSVQSDDESGGNDDGSFVDTIACPEGTDPADCPEQIPYEPGPPPEDPPNIGLPGSVKASPLVLGNGESKSMRLTVVPTGDADVDVTVTSEPEGGLTTSLSRTSIPMPGSGTTNLTVAARDDAPMGDYIVNVSATNLGMTNTASFKVSVQCDPPVILGINQPQGVVVDHGATATLEVKPDGSAPLKYQWYEGYSGMTFNAIAGATGRVFTTPALNQSTAYWVRVTNGCGTVDSNTATLTVH